MTRAVIYARLSEDRTRTAPAIDRQLEDCRRIAEQQGWVVVEEYIDRGVSAWSGTSRPAYERMLHALRARQFDAIVTYHQDRLTRQPAEFESLIDLAMANGVRHIRTVTGMTDLGQGDSVMVARIFSAVATNQSDAASRRIRRANESKAAQGKPHISGARAYGYELDRVTVVDEEARVIKTLAKRFIAGESLVSLATWLQAQGIKTATGMNDWRTPTLRNLLASPRIAGLREYRGEVVGEAVWEPIITRDEHEQIKARLEASRNHKRRQPRRYLLSGQVFCGLCGTKMVSSPDGGRRRYGCRKGPDFGGCAKIFINAEPLELLLSEAVLLRLESSGVLATTASPGSQSGELLLREAELQQRLNALAEAYGAEQISMQDWLRARKPLEEKLNDTRRAMVEAGGDEVLSEFMGTSADLRAAWTSPDMTLQRQAAVLRRVVHRIVIGPAERPSNRMDPRRVKIEWLV